MYKHLNMKNVKRALKNLQFREHVLYLLYESFAFLPFHRERSFEPARLFQVRCKTHTHFIQVRKYSVKRNHSQKCLEIVYCLFYSS